MDRSGMTGPSSTTDGTSLDLTAPPVLFLVFNRRGPTRRVFEEIRRTRPGRIYVATEGPRSGRPGEAERCAEVREAATHVDWPCELRTLFRDTNLGGSAAVSGAIAWFFEHEPEGLILEDDCLPAASFFTYCAELLDRFRDDERVGMISGRNNLGSYEPDEADYQFTTGGSIWGWATWRRAARGFDPHDPFFFDPRLEAWLNSNIGNRREARYLATACRQACAGKTDTWDYQWGVRLQANRMLACTPSLNLVENLGFGEQATHTIGPDVRVSQVRRHELRTPLWHPPVLAPDLRLSAELAALYLPSRFRSLAARIPGARRLVSWTRNVLRAEPA
jgi:hypothetical protein